MWRDVCEAEESDGAGRSERVEEEEEEEEEKWCKTMDTLALEATGGKKTSNGSSVPPPPVKRKAAKKTKKAVVFFEVEILDAKTKEKLCFLDKVRPSTSTVFISVHHSVFVCVAYFNFTVTIAFFNLSHSEQ